MQTMAMRRVLAVGLPAGRERRSSIDLGVAVAPTLNWTDCVPWLCEREHAEDVLAELRP